MLVKDMSILFFLDKCVIDFICC